MYEVTFNIFFNSQSLKPLILYIKLIVLQYSIREPIENLSPFVSKQFLKMLCINNLIPNSNYLYN